MARCGFEVTVRDGRARCGRLTTSRGEVATPAFMPVGTAGTVKGLTADEVRRCGAHIVLANTYHLYLRPGHDLVAELGGLHRFMQWSGPILTDSGGYQIFSMANIRTLDDDGAVFTSHVDGTEHRLTPEKSMEIQAALGSDIAMAFDECPALPADRSTVERAVDRTTAWARRCRESYRGPGVVFGIVQGGTHADLRERSAAEITALDFPGYAIGGVSVGEPAETIPAILRRTAELLPADRPRYLMGVGRPRDLVEAVAHGIDMFDCVMPTRNARNGNLFTSAGRFNIKRAEFRRDERPIDPDCDCDTCAHYSRAYLRHLFVSGERLAARLHTVHNLRYYLRLMERIRTAIREGRYAAFRRRWADGTPRGDP